MLVDSESEIADTINKQVIYKPIQKDVQLMSTYMYVHNLKGRLVEYFRCLRPLLAHLTADTLNRLDT